MARAQFSTLQQIETGLRRALRTSAGVLVVYLAGMATGLLFAQPEHVPVAEAAVGQSVPLPAVVVQEDPRQVDHSGDSDSTQLETPTPMPTATPSEIPTATPSEIPTAEIEWGELEKCYRELPQLDVQERWAAVAAGEAGRFWTEGMTLTAWTMRSQVVRWLVDPALMGPRLGWYACDLGGIEAALPIVHSVWGRDPNEAPFDFMQRGEWCVHLGSYRDSLKWAAEGLYPNGADVVLDYGRGLSLHCYFDRMPRQVGP